MNSLRYRSACFCLVFFAFALRTNAQACGAYYISVSVRDSAGKAVNNAKVDLKPIQKDESGGKNFVRDTNDPSIHSLQLSEGQIATFFHKIVVSAPGFSPAEVQMKFLSCAD